VTVYLSGTLAAAHHLANSLRNFGMAWGASFARYQASEAFRPRLRPRM
jgi:hypothetical protein